MAKTEKDTADKKANKAPRTSFKARNEELEREVTLLGARNKELAAALLKQETKTEHLLKQVTTIQDSVQARRSEYSTELNKLKADCAEQVAGTVKELQDTRTQLDSVQKLLVKEQNKNHNLTVTETVLRKLVTDLQAQALEAQIKYALHDAAKDNQIRTIQSNVESKMAINEAINRQSTTRLEKDYKDTLDKVAGLTHRVVEERTAHSRMVACFKWFLDLMNRTDDEAYAEIKAWDANNPGVLENMLEAYSENAVLPETITLSDLENIFD